MKRMVFIGLLGISFTCKAQFTNLKLRNSIQDTLLDTVFHAYLKANDSVADLRHIEMINNFSDSADKYIFMANGYLFNKSLDSCIRAIHIANFYIVNTQVLLHIKPEDQYQHSRPTY
jgi:hypothetical protein